MEFAESRIGTPAATAALLLSVRSCNWYVWRTHKANTRITGVLTVLGIVAMILFLKPRNLAYSSKTGGATQ